MGANYRKIGPRVSALEKWAPEAQQLPIRAMCYVAEDGTHIQIPIADTTNPITAPTYKKFKKKLKKLYGKRLCIIVIDRPIKLPDMDADGIPLDMEGKMDQQPEGEDDDTRKITILE